MSIAESGRGETGVLERRRRCGGASRWHQVCTCPAIAQSVTADKQGPKQDQSPPTKLFTQCTDNPLRKSIISPQSSTTRRSSFSYSPCRMAASPVWLAVTASHAHVMRIPIHDNDLVPTQPHQKCVRTCMLSGTALDSIRTQGLNPPGDPTTSLEVGQWSQLRLLEPAWH